MHELSLQVRLGELYSLLRRKFFGIRWSGLQVGFLSMLFFLGLERETEWSQEIGLLLVGVCMFLRIVFCVWGMMNPDNTYFFIALIVSRSDPFSCLSSICLLRSSLRMVLDG